MVDTVNLVLYPQVQEGAELSTVKEKLCKTLSIDAATVDSWYATDNPTAILKDVDEVTGGKYASAIQQCGAQCNLQPSGEDKSGWSLEDMTKAKIVEYFLCPSCEHEEEFPRGAKPEQCPKCGLVIAKWEEKMREEAEKEKIRRRLMRDQRLHGDREAEMDAKKAELARLKALELEIMKELGIRPPSRLWMIFEQYTISIGLAISMSIVMATGVAFKYVDDYIEKLDEEALAAAEPTEEMKGIAPVMAAAIAMQQNGKEEVVQEIADVTDVMRGQSTNGAREALIAASQQMMKGVDQEKFLAAAGQMAMKQGMAQMSAGQSKPSPVNLDTIGGVTGLQGIPAFAPTELMSMAPPLLEHGHDRILEVMSEKTIVKDLLDPEGPDIVVDRIDEMDGSMIVDLMSTISKDQEWDQYLLSHVKGYIANGEMEKGSELANRIKNGTLRIRAYGEIIKAYLEVENASEIKLLMARVNLDIDKITDPDAKAKVILDLGKDLAAAGSKSEPYDSIERVSAMANGATAPFEQSYLTSRLAVAYMQIDDQDTAKRLLSKATTIAGRIPETSQRISAFTRIAQRYYDVRNNTLASEILSEASKIAATDLEQHLRSVAFGEIAIAQAYLGDYPGAEMSIANGGEGKGKQQLIAKVAESLIGYGRYYEALSWMESLEDEVEYSRLELRLSSSLFYEGRTQEAINRIDQSAARTLRIYELAERSLLTSQYARFFSRFGQQQRAEQMFSDAEAISKQLSGRKSQIAMALVALDRARVFFLPRAKEIVVDELTDSVVRDPIDAEILATERIIKNLLPEDILGSDND